MDKGNFKMKVPFFKHSVGEEEKRAVIEALDSDFLTTGSYVKKFEEKFSEYVRVKNTAGVMSCTAALHLSLLACGIGPGDEVITTPQTFVATTLAILHCGATPVLVDVEPFTGNIDATKIEEKITEKTKAIIPVHLYGQICDMLLIRSIANRHHLYIIEDAAHALTSSRGSVRVGQLGDLSCFSFYATKSITCGEGGAVCTNNAELHEKVMNLRTHGMSTDAAQRFSGKYKHWDLTSIGWKYNMDNIKAAMLLPQLNKAQRHRDQRMLHYRKYCSLLDPGIKRPAILDEVESDYHLFTIWVDPEKRDQILWGLQEKEIGATVNYRSINLLSALSKKLGWHSGQFPNSELIGNSTISLPLYPSLTEDQVCFVCKTVNNLV